MAPVGLVGTSAFAAAAAAVVIYADFCFWYVDFGLIPCTDVDKFRRLACAGYGNSLVDGEGRTDVK